MSAVSSSRDVSATGGATGLQHGLRRGVPHWRLRIKRVVEDCEGGRWGCVVVIEGRIGWNNEHE